MKRALHTFLLGFYLLSCLGLQELTRLPVLFQHYFEHKSEDHNVTFLAYLEHHYNDVPHNDNDAERDSQLPFKTHEFFAGSVISPALPPTFENIPKRIYQVIARQKNLVINEHVPHSAFAGKIWQPPKIVS